MPEWLSRFSSQYYIDLHDYGRPSDWLLVSSGSGVMMAAMDACPQFRWCMDIDALGNRSRFSRWLQWADNFVSGIGVVGWFSITDPEMLRNAIGNLRRQPIIYTPFAEVGLGRYCSRFEDFVRNVEKSELALDLDSRNGADVVQSKGKISVRDWAAGKPLVSGCHQSAVHQVGDADRNPSGLAGGVNPIAMTGDLPIG